MVGVAVDDEPETVRPPELAASRWASASLRASSNSWDELERDVTTFDCKIEGNCPWNEFNFAVMKRQSGEYIKCCLYLDVSVDWADSFLHGAESVRIFNGSDLCGQSSGDSAEESRRFLSCRLQRSLRFLVPKKYREKVNGIVLSLHKNSKMWHKRPRENWQ